MTSSLRAKSVEFGYERRCTHRSWSMYQRTVSRRPALKACRGDQPSSLSIFVQSMAYRRSWPWAILHERDPLFELADAAPRLIGDDANQLPDDLEIRLFAATSDVEGLSRCAPSQHAPYRFRMIFEHRASRGRWPAFTDSMKSLKAAFSNCFRGL